MSDALARKLRAAAAVEPKPKSHDERLVEAMEKALANTTIHKAGTPWDEVEGREDDRRRTGFFIPESD